MKRAPFAALIALLFASLLPFLSVTGSAPVQAWRAIQLPWHTCQTESAILAAQLRVARASPLYPALDQLPLLINIYHLLSYAPVGLAARAAGTDEPGWLLFRGRAISFFFSCALALLLALYAWRLAGKNGRWLALLPLGMAFYFHSSVMTEFIRNRPEPAGIALAFGGWLCMRYRDRTRPERAMLAAAVLTAAAFAFKQWFLAAPLAIGVELLIARDWRALRPFLLAYALLVGGFVGILALITHGHSLDHTVRALASNPTHPWTAAKNFYPILTFHHWRMLLPAAVIAILYLMVRREERALLVYLALSLAWTTYSAGKAGADLHYFAELSTLLVAAVAAAVIRALADAREKASRAHSLVLAAILLCLSGGGWFMAARHGFNWNTVFWYRIYSDPNGVIDRPFFWDVGPYVERFRPLPGRALFLNDELAARTGRIEALDWYLVDLAIQRGLVSLEPLLADIRAKRFERIVFHKKSVPSQEGKIRAVATSAGYRLAFTDGTIEEWIP